VLLGGMRTRAPYELFRVDGSPYWYCYFLDRNGKRVRKSTKETVAARAHAVAREWERRYADPTYRAANDTTLDDACENLIEYLANKGRSPDTRKFYRTKCSQVARLLGKDTPLSQIGEPRVVDGYIRDRRREGAHPHTISKELTALRMMLRVARRRGEFDREISQVMPVGFATGYKPRERWLTQGEAWQLISALEPAYARYAAFVCATTARDAAVPRALGADLLPEGIRVKDRKTKLASRIVPITRITRPFAARAFDGIAPDAAVCPGIGSVRHAFDRATAKIGIGHVSPNDLRRSVAHWLKAGGVPPDVAAMFFGHASTKMMYEIYGKLDTEEIGAAIARALGGE
jgi:integrase